MASEIPEDDAPEQSLSVTGEPDDDAVEQVARLLARDPEVPDADALEQAETVPLDDDDRYGSEA